MKLLCITPEYPPDYGGGIASFYGALLPALARQGIDVTVVAGSAYSPSGSRGEDGGVHIVPLNHARAKFWAGQFPRLSLAPDLCRHLGAAWAAWEQTNGGRDFDVVECCDWGLQFVPWLSSEAPPCVVRLHGSIGQIARYDPQSGQALTETLAQLAEHALLPRAAARVTYGARNQQWWQDQLNAEVEHCPPPFCVSDAPSLDVPRPPHQGLVVGRLQSWKGPVTLCKALTALGEDAPIIEWVGRDMPTPGTRAPMSTTLAQDFPAVWGSRLRWYQPEPPDAIRQRQATSQFVVVPSEWDVFNLGAVEAMSQGAIVICSDGAGASTLIEPGATGFTYPAGDSDALAVAIRKTVRLSPDAAAHIGKAARATVQERLNPENIARTTIKTYERARMHKTRGLPMIGAFMPQKYPAAAVSRLGFAGLDRVPLQGLLKYIIKRTFTRR